MTKQTTIVVIGPLRVNIYVDDDNGWVLCVPFITKSYQDARKEIMKGSVECSAKQS